MTDQYKQVAPAGIAPEVTALNGGGASRETTARFGAWLAGVLGDTENAQAQLATLSGMSPLDLSQLLEGHPAFMLDTDHVQRLSTALAEMGLIQETSIVWDAAEMGQSDYIIPPASVVDTMSGG